MEITGLGGRAPPLPAQAARPRRMAQQQCGSPTASRPRPTHVLKTLSRSRRSPAALPAAGAARWGRPCPHAARRQAPGGGGSEGRAALPLLPTGLNPAYQRAGILGCCSASAPGGFKETAAAAAPSLPPSLPSSFLSFPSLPSLSPSLPPEGCCRGWIYLAPLSIPPRSFRLGSGAPQPLFLIRIAASPLPSASRGGQNGAQGLGCRGPGGRRRGGLQDGGRCGLIQCPHPAVHAPGAGSSHVPAVFAVTHE